MGLPHAAARRVPSRSRDPCGVLAFAWPARAHNFFISNPPSARSGFDSNGGDRLDYSASTAAAREPARTGSSNAVRKGMYPDEVYRILGDPSNQDRANLGAFEQITATWVQSGSLTRVIFINEVAVKITVESR